MKKAILFDIDGTLLYAKGVGRPAFQKAFKKAYGIDVDFSNKSFVGTTDTTVIREVAAAHGIISTPAHEEYFYIELTKVLDPMLETTPPLVYEGVYNLLSRLQQEGYLLGIVTGNIRETAWSKLVHGQLAQFFSFGAYSTDHFDRDHLAAIAKARALALGAEVQLLSGDTPKDIQAAHAIQVPCLAVTTGWIDAATLQQSGADAIVPNFSETEIILSKIKELSHD